MMFGKWLPSFMISTLLLAPGAKADDSTPTERFTRSIVTLYVSAEMCNQISALHTENFAIVIRNYLGSQFHTGIPFWVLPEVHEHIKNVDSCMLRIKQGLMHYETDSTEYATYYPEQPAPPVMAAFFAQDVTDTAAHSITPSVIVH